MPKNKYGLKAYPIYRLKVGECCLVGPFKSPNAAGVMCVKARRRKGCERMQWQQRQVLLVDVAQEKVGKMYVITRVEDTEAVTNKRTE